MVLTSWDPSFELRLPEASLDEEVVGSGAAAVEGALLTAGAVAAVEAMVVTVGSEAAAVEADLAVVLIATEVVEEETMGVDTEEILTEEVKAVGVLGAVATATMEEVAAAAVVEAADLTTALGLGQGRLQEDPQDTRLSLL